MDLGNPHDTAEFTALFNAMPKEQHINETHTQETNAASKGVNQPWTYAAAGRATSGSRR